MENPIPSMVHTRGRELTRKVLLLEKGGVGVPHRIPWPFGNALERQAPRMSIWKINGADVQRSQSAIGN